ncbi:MAG TPA: oxidoreductase [Parvularcula sp.]|nr:oxidoreductase [Parvularcula sp.]HBS35781.1 oxidoreductase [Parvularcula sp.]
MATLYLDAAGAAPAEEIALAAWREGVRPEAGRFALVIPNTEDVRALGEVLSGFDAVILEFPAFADGRAYSQARLLRERLGFAGEIRARGAVLPDQALFMARAGFTALEIGERDPAPYRAALGAYTVFYQPAADAALSAHALRARRAEAA